MLKPNIVHEAQTQRQHVRVRLPAHALIGNKRYTIRDISASGLAIENFTQSLKSKTVLPVTLALALDGFSFNIDLKTQVAYYNAASQILGCTFDHLNREQISILNLVIKSYLSGVLVTQGDILNTISRDNFALARTNPSKPAKTNKIKRLFFSCLIVSLAAGALFFLSGNVYEKIAVLKSYDSTVQDTSSIEALLSARDVQRLHIGDRATITIAGQAGTISGQVEQFHSMPDNPATALITIHTDHAIDAALIGRPAYTQFYLH